MKLKYLCIGLILALLLVGTVAGGIFTIDDAKAAIAIKPISSTGVTSKDAVLEKDLKTDVLQTVKLEISSLGKVSESKTIQLYPGASVFISYNIDGSYNIMQISTKVGYPLLETYYQYQKSRSEPWQYYFRVDRIDGDYAYMVYGDHAKREVRLGTIPRSNYDTIIAGGKIPEWKSVTVGG